MKLARIALPTIKTIVLHAITHYSFMTIDADPALLVTTEQVTYVPHAIPSVALA